MEVKKVRVTLEGMGYKTETGIALLATEPTKTISIEFLTENSKEKMEE